MNKCFFTGNLAADVESRFSQSGSKVVKFRIGVSSGFGEHKRTEWVSCVAFGKTADVAEQYLQKGSKVLVSTELKTDKWKDKDGNDRYSQNYIVNDLEFLSSKKEGQSPPAPPEPFQNSTGESVPF